MGDDKAAIRRVLRTRRRGLSADAIVAAAVAVANRVLTFGPYLEARTVVAYVAS